MGIMLVAHYLYSNATAKGEHCIPCTWDMFHENYG
jgi:delta24(24(1))-sterol reductase